MKFTIDNVEYDTETLDNEGKYFFGILTELNEEENKLKRRIQDIAILRDRYLTELQKHLPAPAEAEAEVVAEEPPQQPAEAEAPAQQG